MFDQSKVEECHATVFMKDVVARMRVAIELMHSVQTAKHESKETLASEILLLLILLHQFSK